MLKRSGSDQNLSILLITPETPVTNPVIGVLIYKRYNHEYKRRITA